MERLFKTCNDSDFSTFTRSESLGGCFFSVLRRANKILDKPKDSVSLVSILEYSSTYFFDYIASLIALSIWLLIAFLSLLFHADASIRGKLNPGLLTILQRALVKFFKKGLVTIIFSSVLLLSIATLAQVLLAASSFSQLLILLAQALFLIIPLLLVHSSANAFTITKSALNFSYLPPIKGIKWSMFVQLLSWQMLLFIFLSLYNYAPIALKAAYELFSNTAPLIDSKVNLQAPYVLGTIFGIFTLCLGLCFLAILMTVTYYRILTITQGLKLQSNQDA